MGRFGGGYGRGLTMKKASSEWEGMMFGRWEWDEIGNGRTLYLGGGNGRELQRICGGVV